MKKILDKLKRRWEEYLLDLIVIVVGILGAYMLNDWKERHSESILLQDYYEQILVDLKVDSVETAIQLKNINLSLASLENYFDKLDSVDAPIEYFISESGKVNFTVINIRFQSNTYQTLQTTGDMRLLPVNIRNQLLELDRLKQEINSSDDLNNEKYYDIMVKTLYEYPGGLYFRRMNNPKLKSELLKGINLYEVLLHVNSAFDMKLWAENGKLESYNSYLDQLSRLTNLIKTNLR